MKPNSGGAFFTDDPVKVYLAEVDKVPPLTRDEEVRLVELAQSGGPGADAARKRLMEAHLHLVVKIADRYGESNIHMLELLQKGNEGLIKAVQTIGTAGQESLADYATPLIKQAIDSVV